MLPLPPRRKVQVVLLVLQIQCHDGYFVETDALLPASAVARLGSLDPAPPIDLAG